MKLFKLFLILLMFASCRTVKETTETVQETAKTTEVATAIDLKKIISIDTTKSSDMEVVYKKIEYFQEDTIKLLPENRIKSIETLTVRKKTEQKGTTELISEEKRDSAAVVKENSSIESNKTTRPAADPKRLRYIFYILMLLTGIFIYVIRLPIMGKLKTVLSWIVKKVKI